jgi:hypothetical protein
MGEPVGFNECVSVSAFKVFTVRILGEFRTLTMAITDLCEEQKAHSLAIACPEKKIMGLQALVGPDITTKVGISPHESAKAAVVIGISTVQSWFSPPAASAAFISARMGALQWSAAEHNCHMGSYVCSCTCALVSPSPTSSSRTSCKSRRGVKR